MCHVKGIWTNRLWGASTETDVDSDTMRFKLAPYVARIHIQLRLWMGMKAERRKQMLGCNCSVVRWWWKCCCAVCSVNPHWEKGTEGNTTDMIFVLVYNPTFIVYLHFFFGRSYRKHWRPLVTVIYLWPEHNGTLAGCFYTKCFTWSCVHTFLTYAFDIGIEL